MYFSVIKNLGMDAEGKYLQSELCNCDSLPHLNLNKPGSKLHTC